MQKAVEQITDLGAQFSYAATRDYQIIDSKDDTGHATKKECEADLKKMLPAIREEMDGSFHDTLYSLYCGADGEWT